MSGMKTWRMVVVLVGFWLLVMLYMTSTIGQSENAQHSNTERQLAAALRELNQLKKQSEELDEMARQIKNLQVSAVGGDHLKIDSLSRKLEQSYDKIANMKSGAPQNGLPSAEYEGQRRKVENGLQELWFYVQAQLIETGKALQDNSELVDHMQKIHFNAAEHYRSVMIDLYNLRGMDGGDDWRQQESYELAKIVQDRLDYLQNPADCNRAKKVVCNLNKGCGYGCQLHHVAYCLIVAYGMQRTLILESSGWRYSPQGWERFFLPLSNTCRKRNGASSRGWGAPEAIEDVQVVDLPIVDSMFPKPKFMPLAIPEDLAPRLTRLHGHPFVWWIGQFIRYVTRPQPGLEQDLAETKAKLGYANPIVGIQVRRTDKVGTEAAFHGIEEYMFHVHQYYEYLEQRQEVDARRVYLATDDPNLLNEAKLKYPEYVFISDNDISASASLGTRYSEDSLRGVVTDIELLAHSDFLVCTFSSQVCRVAYEIMQTLHPDASAFFHSLDDIYYYGGQNAHNQVAIQNHEPQNSQEIELREGDLIGVAGNHWDGYSKGVNKRTGQTGLYPSFKVMDHIDIVKMPTYPEADKKPS